MISERIKVLQALCAERGKKGMPTHFEKDYHGAALGQFSQLPHWEKLARSMAYAIENQPVFAYDGENLGGRVYYHWEEPIENHCSELNYVGEAERKFAELYPEAQEMIALHMIPKVGKGHISWFFDRILRYGVEGYRAVFEKALKTARDQQAAEFYQGVIIMLDALLVYNDKHIAAYEKLGNHELAERMKKVPRYPAETFREAVQAFFMQHLVVMRESAFGGNSPGRLDYYLWPYLERDLHAGRCTLEEAKEIIDELFLRIDERIHNRDTWGETIVVGGTHVNGASAVNPLTYIMVRSMIDLNITHPLLYIRVPKDPPRELVELCAEYLIHGNNRAQILYDPAIIGALEKNGVSYEDATGYACGGCMEVGIQGKNSDFLYNGWHHVPKMLELMITGGRCLLSGKQYSCFASEKGLAGYEDFESFYRDFIAEADRVNSYFFKEQDIYSELSERNRPSYLLSSMLDDCLERGRNMHAGGVRYHDYGSTHLGMPNVADGLYAIKKAVFEDKICTAEELIAALEADFVGYEKLQAALRRIPKYGMDDQEADEMANRVMSDFSDMHLRSRTRWGGRGKPVILTFTYAPQAAKTMGATADGKKARSMIAHGVGPSCSSMREGVTAAINSCGKMPFEKFSGGASTMWDFDASWVNENIIGAILMTFMQKGGQIFQGNTTPLEDLLKAQKDPENYEHLMVRVGGYSARFVNLTPDLQNEIIGRMRHSR